MFLNSVKRAICLLVAGLMIVSAFSYSAFAVGHKRTVIGSEAECEELGQSWLEKNYRDDTVIDDIIPILDGEGIISYCVSYASNNEPNGYVVIDTYANVVEFALSGANIYDALHENCREINNRTTKEKKLYSTGLFSYAVSVSEDNTRFYNSTNEILEASELNDLCDTQSWRSLTNDLRKENGQTKGSIYDIIVNYGDLPNSGFRVSRTIGFMGSFTPALMTDFQPDGAFTGNCGPTAAANILIFYKEKRGLSRLGSTRQNIYDRLIAAAGWNQYGDVGLNGPSCCNAIKKVAQTAGYSASYSTILLKQWSHWENSVNDGYPVWTMITGYNNQNNIDYHAVVAFGYCKYVIVSNGKYKENNYLQVWDGWNTSPLRYICFIPSSLATFFPGHTVNIWQ